MKKISVFLQSLQRQQATRMDDCDVVRRRSECLLSDVWSRDGKAWVFWVWVFQKPNKTHHGFNGFDFVGWHCSTVNCHNYYGTNGENVSYQVNFA
jgi:hypothetical protein